MTIAIPGAPTLLAADWRYAGDDWAGANALTYIVYQTAPVLAEDGSVATPGVPRPLTGCTVTGSLRYRSARDVDPDNGPALPTPVGAVLDAAGGLISLSLTKDKTVFPRQTFDAFADPRRSLLLVQPRIVDVGGNVVTVGLQPLFVF